MILPTGWHYFCCSSPTSVMISSFLTILYTQTYTEQKRVSAQNSCLIITWAHSIKISTPCLSHDSVQQTAPEIVVSQWQVHNNFNGAKMYWNQVHVRVTYYLRPMLLLKLKLENNSEANIVYD